jgi:tetratricopeptide (TPR) repeat protein
MSKPDSLSEQFDNAVSTSIGAVAEVIAEEMHVPGDALSSPQAKKAQVALEMQKSVDSFSKSCQEGITLIMQSLKELATHDSTLDLDAITKDLLHGIEKIDSIEKVEVFGMELLQGKSWNDLLKLKHTTLKALYSGAAKIFDAGRYGDAVAAFTFLSTLDNKQFAFWNSLGHAAYHKKDFTLATHAYAAASMCDPSSVWPHIYAANAFEAKNDLAHALLALESAHEINRLSDHKNQDLETTLTSRISALKQMT